MILVSHKPVEFTTYPNGETVLDAEALKKLVKVDPWTGHVMVTFKYENDADLFRLMLVQRVLSAWTLELLIMYMPYSRMDREQEPYGFSLKYVADFINSLNFERVTIWEPHSSVTAALINKANPRLVTLDLLPKVVEEIKFDPATDQVLLPDAGAATRYSGLKGYNFIYGHKARDFTTGALKGFGVSGIQRPHKIIIIDDLVSKGGTFLGLIRAVQAEAPKLEPDIHLVVTHCEVSPVWGEYGQPTDLVTPLISTDVLEKLSGFWTTDSMFEISTLDREGMDGTYAWSSKKRANPWLRFHIYSGGKWQ